MPKLVVDRRLRGATIPPLVLYQPREKLDTPERFLIGVLAMYGEVSFPARETIADLMGSSVATVRRTVARLEAKGWLVVVPRRGDDGKQKSNLYQLRVPDGADPADGVTAGQSAPRSGVQSAPDPVSDCTAIEDSEVRTRESEVGVAAVAANPPDLLFLHHFESEAEDATGVQVIRVPGRDRKMARQVIARCPGGLAEAEVVACRYIVDGKANGWPITLAGLLKQLEVVRQRIAKDGPTKPADGIKREHPMARIDRVTREWHEAHPGKTAQSEQEIIAWARGARRWILPA